MKILKVQVSLFSKAITQANFVQNQLTGPFWAQRHRYWIFNALKSLLNKKSEFKDSHCIFYPCFFLVLWKQRLRKSIGFYDINHYHKPGAGIESWQNKGMGDWDHATNHCWIYSEVCPGENFHNTTFLILNTNKLVSSKYFEKYYRWQVFNIYFYFYSCSYFFETSLI